MRAHEKDRDIRTERQYKKNNTAKNNDSRSGEKEEEV